ncbi:hypothetical protein ASG69_10975 [Rhodococcus sp. Leaf225]|nr:hypothetical protein ASG69_10975 [Rhodococcus sp. Leaf225]KQU44435.1 hypothetical protein ASH03_10430 [Rhodococcus sp. Leaf258]
MGAIVVLVVWVSAPVHCTAADLAATSRAVESAEQPAPVDAETPEFDRAAFLARLRTATDVGAAVGARVSIAFMDRASGFRADNGNVDPIETASVSKLFIADDLFFRDDQGEVDLSSSDTALIVSMLRSSDDSAAEQLWNRFGRSDIVGRVAARYGLSSTSVGTEEEWWRTLTTMPDVVTYYSRLVDGSAGLAPARSASIITSLQNFTASGADGYYQRFGLPDALGGESSIGVKQGWMCCVGGDWIHLSTGVVGLDDRFIVSIGSRENVDMYGGGSIGADHARSTVTAVASALFPPGRITSR